MSIAPPGSTPEKISQMLADRRGVSEEAIESHHGSDSGKNR
jgi:hypothetical protein